MEALHKKIGAEALKSVTAVAARSWPENRPERAPKPLRKDHVQAIVADLEAQMAHLCGDERQPSSPSSSSSCRAARTTKAPIRETRIQLPRSPLSSELRQGFRGGSVALAAGAERHRALRISQRRTLP